MEYLVRDSFITQYLSYVGETEAPIFYHRWSAISMVGAYLGRQYSFSLGHFELYTNLYTMLIGEPGTRKSTAIKIAKKIIAQAGYDKISGDKTSKEKFMMDLAGIEDGGLDTGKFAKSQTMEQLLDEQLGFNTDEIGEDCEMFIACDEFNDFIGLGNLEFISLLGNLWDYNGVFKNRIKTGKSVSILNPTISILGGNTSTSFANAFPPDSLGQGFFSRLLLIHGEETGKKFTFPALPSQESTVTIISALQRIKMVVKGKAELDEDAKLLLDKIYKNSKKMEDIRFASYSNRRFTHLLKLCLIISASYYSTVISAAHVIEANTLLTHTESLMPKALGQFGRARNSEVTHKIMSILNNATAPMSIREIWAYCVSDMEKVDDLMNQIRSLLTADMIFAVDGKYLSKPKIVQEVDSDTVDYNYLSAEERGMK
jgi:hypothetical protein